MGELTKISRSWGERTGYVNGSADPSLQGTLTYVLGQVEIIVADSDFASLVRGSQVTGNGYDGKG